MRSHTLLCLTFALAALTLSAAPAPARAVALDPLIEGAKQCTRALPHYEKQYGIPAHLLSAIATTESGRYHSGLKISVPWPWTVNAEGRGYYFDTKAEAVAAVQRFKRQGIKSIDVGCMQVNLYHHPNAFNSLDEAFDPQHNVAYAASFLSNLHDESGSWKSAASHYHSKTPEKGSKYVGRVYASWNKLVDKLRLAKLTVPDSSLAAMREMKPRPGAGYAKVTEPVMVVAHKKPQAKPLPEQRGKDLPAYKAPRMNTVALSAKPAHKDTGLIVVKPEIKVKSEIKTASAASALPDTGLLRIGSSQQVVNNRKAGPNFIFND